MGKMLVFYCILVYGSVLIFGHVVLYMGATDHPWCTDE